MPTEPTIYGYLNVLPKSEYERWLSISSSAPLLNEVAANPGPALISPPQMARALTIQSITGTAIVAFGLPGGPTIVVSEGNVLYVNPTFTDSIYLLQGNCTVFHGQQA